MVSLFVFELNINYFNRKGIKMDPRKSRLVYKPEEVNYLLNISDDILNRTSTTIMELFGEFNGKSKFNPYDIIEIPSNSYGPEGKKNKKPFKTTVGIWVFNKYFIEKDLFHIFKYINKTVDDGLFGEINTTLSYALAEDKIDTKILADYSMKCQLFMSYVSILSPNFTEKMLTCSKVINKKKKELLDKYGEELKAGNEVVATKMEKELLEFAQEYMKGDPSMDMFLSGARGSVGNNFKNMFVMKGVIKDPDPNAKQPYKVATSNYIDGISPEEYALFANALAAGPYSRAAKTANGGYLEKLFLGALQHIVVGPEGSDCKTKNTITVTLDKKNIKSYMYSYIQEGDKLIELTSENVDKYMGKKVKLRFASLCEFKDGVKCHKCMGNAWYRLGKENAGTATPKIPSTLKNISMKAFHDSVQKLTAIDIDKVF